MERGIRFRDGRKQWSAIGLMSAYRGHQDLPELDVSCAKRTGAGKQVILPHPLEFFAIVILEAAPCFLKAFVPGQEGLFVMGT